jgi:hypothetical protein
MAAVARPCHEKHSPRGRWAHDPVFSSRASGSQRAHERVRFAGTRGRTTAWRPTATPRPRRAGRRCEGTYLPALGERCASQLADARLHFRFAQATESLLTVPSAHVSGSSRSRVEPQLRFARSDHVARPQAQKSGAYPKARLAMVARADGSRPILVGGVRGNPRVSRATGFARSLPASPPLAWRHLNHADRGGPRRPARLHSLRPAFRGAAQRASAMPR